MSQECRRCHHPLKKHCKGEQDHTSHKEDAQIIGLKYRKAGYTCHTRHCLEPLCDCTDYVEKK